MKIKSVLLPAAIFVFAGCASFPHSSRHYASSLLQFLYPHNQSHTDKPQVATLTLPLRVGVAFVPEDAANRTPARLAEEQKIKLLQEVSTNFAKYPFVQRIEVIPSAYLAPGGGFENVDQLRQMFNVDVIALVSYDQLQFHGSSRLSIAYLTVVGAYLINGENNDTRTMIDTAVYDIRSRKLLFRAPGLSEIKGSASLVNEEETLRRNGELGFQQASTNLTANLEMQLAQFRERIKERPADVQIVRGPGYTGAGGVGAAEMVAALAGLVSICMLKRRRV